MARYDPIGETGSCRPRSARDQARTRDAPPGPRRPDDRRACRRDDAPPGSWERGAGLRARCGLQQDPAPPEQPAAGSLQRGQRQHGRLLPRNAARLHRDVEVRVRGQEVGDLDGAVRRLARLHVAPRAYSRRERETPSPGAHLERELPGSDAERLERPDEVGERSVQLVQIETPLLRSDGSGRTSSCSRAGRPRPWALAEPRSPKAPGWPASSTRSHCSRPSPRGSR